MQLCALVTDYEFVDFRVTKLYMAVFKCGLRKCHLNNVNSLRSVFCFDEFSREMVPTTVVELLRGLTADYKFLEKW